MNTENQPSTGKIQTTQPEDDAYEQWQAAEKAQQQVVIQKQIELLKAKAKLERIRGTEDPKQSLLAIVDAFPTGIPFPFVKSVFDVSVNLTRARNELVEEKLIDVDDKRRAMKLFRVKPTAQATEEAAK